MKKPIIIVIIIALISFSFKAFSQVGIGTNAPSASAALEVNSKTQGFLMPRMRKAQMEAIKAPAEGLMVYCLDCTPKGFHVYNGRGFINANTGEYLDGPDKIAAIVAASTVPAAGGTPSLADLAAAHVTNATGNQAAYEEAIARASPVPTILRELQGIINFVNDAFYEIWEDSYGGGKNANGTLVSYEQLEATGVKELIRDNLGAYQHDILNASFSKTPTVTEIQTIIDAVNVCLPASSFAPTKIVEVLNPKTGRIWMDRNLGASRAATSRDDVASYGHLYQWGRNTDGHHLRTSCTKKETVIAGREGYKFIKGSSDWLDIQDDKRWNSGDSKNIIKSDNDPCPKGFRVPTEQEVIAEIATWATKDLAGAFASYLKLPLSGWRTGDVPDGVGSSGYIWTSTVSGASARYLGFGNSVAEVFTHPRTLGFPVRCIKE